MKYPDTFAKAELIVDADPLPEDYVEQLEALQAETPEKFHDDFAEYYSTAFINRGIQLSRAEG